MDIKELKNSGFRFKKNLGQNFLTDSNLLRAFVKDAGVTNEDTVVEIGAGAGTLTRALAQKAKRVVAFEIDEELTPVLNKVKEEYPSVEIRFEDVLKLSDEQIKERVSETFVVVANLPYYVTTPMIMKFVDGTLDVKSMTLLMQKEVAERLIAKPKTSEYGAITAAIDAVADTEIMRIVDRRMFYPVPNVDSALVKITFNRNKYNFSDYKIFKKTVKAAFAMRRKTLVNNLISAFSISRENAENIVVCSGYEKTVRGEELSCEEFVALSDKIADLIKQKA